MLNETMTEKIVKRANRILYKPRKSIQDITILFAAILIVKPLKGQDWVDKNLERFGWKEPMTEEIEELILLKAAEIVMKEDK